MCDDRVLWGELENAAASCYIKLSKIKYHANVLTRCSQDTVPTDWLPDLPGQFNQHSNHSYGIMNVILQAISNQFKYQMSVISFFKVKNSELSSVMMFQMVSTTHILKNVQVNLVNSFQSSRHLPGLDAQGHVLSAQNYKAFHIRTLKVKIASQKGIK